MLKPKRKRQQQNLAELGELAARIAQCQKKLAEVMAAHRATMDAVARLEQQIKERPTLESASARGHARRASVAPAKAAKKGWRLWRRRVAVPA
jgi:hypothetical protein